MARLDSQIENTGQHTDGADRIFEDITTADRLNSARRKLRRASLTSC